MPHAHALGVERAPQDAGGAAAVREVRLRHDGGRQGSRDHRLALPAVRPASHPDAPDSGPPAVHLRQGRYHGRPGRAPRHRARRGGRHARRALVPRPADRVQGHHHHGRGRPERVRARLAQGARRPRRSDPEGRRGGDPAVRGGVRLCGQEHAPPSGRAAAALPQPDRVPVAGRADRRPGGYARPGEDALGAGEALRRLSHLPHSRPAGRDGGQAALRAQRAHAHRDDASARFAHRHGGEHRRADAGRPRAGGW